MNGASKTRVSSLCSRRAAVRAALLATALTSLGQRGWAHDAYGRVVPAQLTPRIRVAPLDAPLSDLQTLLRGNVTALQLMFTSCSATCPIQGAMFAELQKALRGTEPHFRLLSVSIDPLGDDAKGLRAWLRSFGAEPTRWTAALSLPPDLDALLGFLRGRAAGVDRHTPQVYLFDCQARLSLRTVDLPSASSVKRMMQELNSLG